MIDRYYQQELAKLRDLGDEFAKAHPAVAPMLSGMSADPDVERLLEGVAFLTALLRQKLDDEFPEIIHELTRLLWPHYLRPIPAATTLAFTPRATLKQSMVIPAGIHTASLPVDGTPCLFKTCFPVEIHPLRLVDAAYTEAAGRPPAIHLAFELTGPSLADWQPKTVRLFLAGDYPAAANLYFLFRKYLKRILISASDNSSVFELSPDSVKPVGFEADEMLIPYPTNSFPGYRIIQEYFVFPQKYLYLDLVGWEGWHDRGEGSRFEISFEFDKVPVAGLRVKADDFVLFATPAVNIFPFDSDPIRLDHRKTQYRVRPHCANDTHYQVYAVQKVVGFVQGTAQEREYAPFELFRSDYETHPIYHTKTRTSPVRPGYDVMLSVIYPAGSELPFAETLSIQLLCTNGFLPEGIQAGDISQPTSSSPEFVDFRNLRRPTSSIMPPLGGNLLWRLLSHLSLNYTSLASAENLRALLGLYNFEHQRERAGFLANQKRVAGIESLETRGVNRLVSGILMRGRDIRLDLRQDHFASQGDLYLFSCILDYFLGSYASINTFTRLVTKEVLTGEIHQWPARLGEHPLI